MKCFQTVGLIMAPLALMACQGEASNTPLTGEENGSDKVVNTPATNAPDSAENNAEAAIADPSTPNTAETSAAAQSASNTPDPEKTPARSKLQRAD